MFANAHAEIAGREEALLAALGISWPGRGGHIRCPFPDHEDRNPSWRWDSDLVRWFCTCGHGDVFDAIGRMRGCTPREVLAFVSGKHIPVAPRIRKSRAKRVAVIRGRPPHVCAAMPSKEQELHHFRFGPCSRFWAYPDTSGAIYGVVARYERPGGKEVLPWHFDGGRWVNRRAPNPWPLFRLPDILADPEAPILFVEGEKAAIAAEKIFRDYAVTTSSGGCHAHNGTDYAPLKGRHVTIWPDNDAPGRTYAEAVAAHAKTAGAKLIAIVQPPEGWPDGWDLADDVPSDSIDLVDLVTDARLS